MPDRRRIATTAFLPQAQVAMPARRAPVTGASAGGGAPRAVLPVARAAACGHGSGDIGSSSEIRHSSVQTQREKSAGSAMTPRASQATGGAQGRAPRGGIRPHAEAHPRSGALQDSPLAPQRGQAATSVQRWHTTPRPCATELCGLGAGASCVARRVTPAQRASSPAAQHPPTGQRANCHNHKSGRLRSPRRLQSTQSGAMRPAPPRTPRQAARPAGRRNHNATEQLGATTQSVRVQRKSAGLSGGSETER